MVLMDQIIGDGLECNLVNHSPMLKLMIVEGTESNGTCWFGLLDVNMRTSWHTFASGFFCFMGATFREERMNQSVKETREPNIWGS